MADEVPAEQGPGLAGAFLVASFYVFLLGWLVLFVTVPVALLRWQPIVITSGSMAPVIRSGDVVLVERRPAEALGPGSVITFEDPAVEGRLLTHRIAAVNPDGTYRTRGDANAVPDSTPVPAEAIVGVGRLLVPLVGLPLTWLLRGALGLLLVWVLATVAALSLALDAPVVHEEARDVTPSRRRRLAGVRESLARPVVGSLLWGRARAIAWSRVVLDAMDTTRRARPTAVRAWTPTVVGLASTGVLATASTGAAVAAFLTTLGLLVADPGGPELRIGRWARQARAGSRAAGVTGRRVRVWAGEGATASIVSPVLAVLLLALGPYAAGRPSAAAFAAATANGANAFSAGTWAPCATPGSVTDLVPFHDTYVDEAAPAANHSGSDPIQVRSLAGGNQRGLLEFVLPAGAAGCTVIDASITLQFTTVSPGRSLAFQATATTFDYLTVTWTDQPAVAGGVDTAVTTATGSFTFTIDTAAQGMLDTGTFSLRVSDLLEGSAVSADTFFESLSATTPATLTMSWF